MSRRIPARISIVGLVAAAVVTTLVTAPAQAAPNAGTSLATNAVEVTYSPTQRKVAVAQLHKERQAARTVARNQRAASRAEGLRARAVAIALAQVGDNYAGGAEGPNAFDCSGLTKYAWKRAGINLEHYSVAQYQSTKRVGVKQAQPGDLVFYLDNGAHHVGMYIGRGKIVHASDYGVGVIVSPMLGSAWTNAHFTGVGRVV